MENLLWAQKILGDSHARIKERWCWRESCVGQK